MKIWSNTIFDGFYPVGTAAIIIAKNKEEAARMLEMELEQQGLPQIVPPEHMEEILFKPGTVKILHDGNY